MFHRPRVIPSLLLRKNGLVKTLKFKDQRYIGDPINAVKIFNEKGVDELVLLDITATTDKRGPNLPLLARIAAEAFMPMAYGGGITQFEEIREILRLGYEKVIMNTSAIENAELIREASECFGSQSIVISLDTKKNFFGNYHVMTHSGSNDTKLDPVQFAQEAEKLGAGEILLYSVDKDGTMSGYDLSLIKKVSEAVNLPVVACGGAGRVDDFAAALHAGAAAVSAGSLFVFYGKHKAVLITFPTDEELTKAGVFES
ncbi:MAG: AglZ/HisF2 family acetamidino modification protein [Sporomusaceae bacterium]|nr:AglZ/HisF2 family acetamidino modification protein [Sporomusaceae bacterium]